MKTKRFIIRLVLLFIGIGIWFTTQFLIEERGWPEHCIGDAIFDLTRKIHAFLEKSVRSANALLIVSSAIIDVVTLLMIGKAMVGKTFRPIVGMFMIFILRQMCQLITSLAHPSGEIWRYPGFPSIFVTYGVSDDLFFSGHTALATYGCIELHRMKNTLGINALSFCIILFEITTVLVLRAHYFMDVYAGFITACLISFIDQKVASRVDLWIKRLSAPS